MDKLTIKTETTVLRINTQSIVVSLVDSVNGKFGAVVLSAEEIGADPLGSAQAVQENVDAEIKPQLESLSDNKLDKVDYVQHHLGTFISKASLDAAHPTARAGDSADIDSGSGFDVMRAIWDDSDQKWVIREVGNASNTDQVPEGNTNLYFKGDRVLQVPMTGLSVVPASGVLSTDELLIAIAKLQSQINAIQPVWVEASEIGTVSASVVDCRIQFARINGLLWIRGDFRSNLIFAGNPIITITNQSYKVKTITLTESSTNILALINDYVADIVASDGLRLAANGNNIQKIEANVTHAAESFYFRKIQPTCLGQLEI